MENRERTNEINYCEKAHRDFIIRNGNCDILVSFSPDTCISDLTVRPEKNYKEKDQINLVSTETRHSMI